jgi:hypothetical protein
MGSFEVWSGEMKLENHPYYTKKGHNIQGELRSWTVWGQFGNPQGKGGLSAWQNRPRQQKF